MPIIAIANQKGGTGKTTTAVNLSAYLADFGNKVLLVDVDPQGNATSGLGQSKDPPTLYEVLSQNFPIASAIHSVTQIQNLYLISSNNNLTGVEVELIGVPRREYRLYEHLKRISQDYDLVILDCPPSLSLLTVMALTSADKVLIPVQSEFYALEGLSQLMKTISVVRERLNPSLEVLGVVLTMVDQRTRLSLSVVEEVRNYFKEKTFQSVIPRNVRLGEAPSYGQPIFLYDPACSGAKAYKEFAIEVALRLHLDTPKLQ